MNQDLFKEKKKVLIRNLNIAGILLVLAQGLSYSSYLDNFRGLIQILTFLGVGLATVSLVRVLYLFAVSKKIMSPVVSLNPSQGDDYAEMRPPFKIGLFILFSLMILALIGAMVLLISSNF